MGVNQADSDVAVLIEKSLGIDPSHLRPCISDRGSVISCLVHESWLKEIISCHYSNTKYIHPSSEYERQLMLQPSHTGPYPPWVRICIKILRKPMLLGNSERAVSLKTANQSNGCEFSMDLTVAELMQAVSKDIHRHKWNEALENYSLAMSYLPKHQQKQIDGQEIVRKLTQKIFGLSVIHLGKENNKELKTREKTSDTLFDDLEPQNSNIEQSSVVPLVCALENDEAFFFVEPFFRHGLQDISTFTPAVLSHSTTHLLYVIYQALHGLNWFHKHGVPFGKLGLDSIRLDKGLILYLTTPSWKDLVVVPSILDKEVNKGLSEEPARITQSYVNGNHEVTSEEYTLEPRPPKHDLMTLVDMWVRDEVTNYDYLMALNYFAGRRHGDPNYHPLFPWVTDFTSQEGGYRDLSRSKFRLNKGDHQLDMTYKQALYDAQEGGNTAVAHHVSDVLSDITFHAYLARRTPVSVLCEHLRSNWVPNEYPSTMERLYSWTPDECIPQFFSDPTIFKSIHEDLPDLELPAWTPTAEEFIKWHRDVLESDEVSRNLHQWIDLTFGYKLSGKAAVRAKNVCLHLVNKNQDVNNYGVVQLFSKPHPSQSKITDLLKLTSSQDSLSRRFVDSGGLQAFSMSSYLKSNLNESMISLDSIDEGAPVNSDQSHNISDDSPKITEADKIFLPDDFNPLKLLETYESIHKFKRQFPVKNKLKEDAERPEVHVDEAVLDKLMQVDIEALGCIFVEMVLPEKVRLVSAGLSQQQKILAIKNLCTTHPKALPRYLRTGVLRMLNLQSSPSSSLTNTNTDLHSWPDANNDIPSLNAGLILHPHTGIFPFPAYFKDLHSFLIRFTKARLKDRYHREESSLNIETAQRISLQGLEHCFSNKSEYSTSQVDIAAEILPSLLPNLDEEGVYLLVYHLEPLFTNYETRLYAFTHLFDTVAQHLGPKSTLKTFLKPLVELCDSRLLQNYEHLAAQSFLSQIIVRFGLEPFLAHFVNFAVDAVAFELMLEKTKRATDRISVHSNEGIAVEGSESEVEKKKQMNDTTTKRPLYLTDDDTQLSDQEDEEYISRFDDVEDRQNNMNKTLFTCEEEEEKDELQGDKSASEIAVLGVFNNTDSSDVNDDDSIVTKEDKFIVTTSVSEESDIIAAEDADSKEKDLVRQKEISCEDYEELYKQRDPVLQEQNVTGKNESIGGERDSDIDIDMDIHNELDKHDKGKFVVGANVENKQETDKKDQIKVAENDDESINKICKSETLTLFKTDTVSCENNGGDDDEEYAKEIEGLAEESKQVEGRNMEEKADSSSENSSDDEESGSGKEEQYPDVNQSDRPSADVFYQRSTPPLTQGSKATELCREELSPLYVSGIAAESVMWLAPRLGPVLTSQYLAKQLLTMLPQCYMDVVGVAEFEFEDEDRKAKWVLYCLGNFCALYGEAFVLHQYLPFAEKIVKSIHSKITSRGEASLAAVFALIKYCVPYISKETLVENFEILFKTVFQPVLRILSSWNTKFPGGGDARAALCHNYVDLLTVLSLKLERELAKELMTAPLQQFFSCFELVHMKKKEIKLGESSFIAVSSSIDDGDEKANGVPQSPVFEGTIKPDQIEAFYKTTMYEELCQTFSAAMAHHAYVPLCAIMGSKYMENSLYNHDLIWNLCCSHDAQLSHPGSDDVIESHDNFDNVPKDECDDEVERVMQDGMKAKNGNEDESEDKTNSLKRNTSRRIRTPSWLTRGRAEKRKSQSISSSSKPESTHTTASDQYLRGSWLDHWKYQLQSNSRSRGSHFEFQQIKLQTFTGHSGPVRSIYVQDSEHFFLSASKDKTVKLWSLSNHGDGTAQSASSWTYYRHSRGVFAVDMVESLRQAVSCDGSVHIWDPVHGTTIAMLDANKNTSIVSMTTVPAPSQTVVVATSESTVRFIDVRQSRFVHEWKTTSSSAAGTVRDMCCSPDGRWIALGFSSGHVSVLDVRGGVVCSHRRAHTSDIVQVCSFSNNSLFTSSMDQGLSVWKTDGVRLKNLKGHTEPLHLILVQKDRIISSSIANKIGIHELVNETSESSYTSYKLVPEVFRGNMTSLGYLQLNQLFLLGSDTGNITLCA